MTKRESKQARIGNLRKQLDDAVKKHHAALNPQATEAELRAEVSRLRQELRKLEAEE